MIPEHIIQAAAERESLDFATFLQSSPPSCLTPVFDIAGRSSYLVFPELQLDCGATCKGTRTFREMSTLGGSNWVEAGEQTDCFVTFLCSNCRSCVKRFSLSVWLLSDKRTHPDKSCHGGVCFKYGEYPFFGSERLPSKLISLIREDRENFRKGRICESQGFGIAAYAYYRRVIESQKIRIFDRMITVAKRLGRCGDLIEQLQRAKKQKQFSEAVKQVRAGLPDAMMIKNKNPLTLLHGVFSDGLHNWSDEVCLKKAADGRAILIAFVERMDLVLQDDAELDRALANLEHRNNAERDNT